MDTRRSAATRSSTPTTSSSAQPSTNTPKNNVVRASWVLPRLGWVSMRDPSTVVTYGNCTITQRNGSATDGSSMTVNPYTAAPFSYVSVPGATPYSIIELMPGARNLMHHAQVAS